METTFQGRIYDDLACYESRLLAVKTLDECVHVRRTTPFSHDRFETRQFRSGSLSEREVLFCREVTLGQDTWPSKPFYLKLFDAQTPPSPLNPVSEYPGTQISFPA